MSGKYDQVSSSGNSAGGEASIPLVGLSSTPGYLTGGASSAPGGSLATNTTGSYQNYSVNMSSASAAGHHVGTGGGKANKPQGAGSGQHGLAAGTGAGGPHVAQPHACAGGSGGPFIAAPTAPLSFLGAWKAALWGSGDSMAILKFGSIGARLVRRKQLFESRRKVGTLAFFVGALGLIIVYVTHFKGAALIRVSSCHEKREARGARAPHLCSKLRAPIITVTASGEPLIGSLTSALF